ncbi:hypothetical protein CBR_g41682 [Chara braunii]|uniref:Myb/SANT-like DNA-binding domain-containing protein n=1 Tax=Chara braunii TaxID=69332 RepID=A0A388LWB4_CHABU|nr:hypothetical protein CBR_g41682 [Chara braunii]|eukprot:GBG86618.1 hypothetical protein CBR_g41682 [Chara braunii]
MWLGPKAASVQTSGGAKMVLRKTRSIPWTLDERIALSIMMAEDDALMADADGQHRFKRSKDRYEWVHDRMAEQGFLHRSAEDCRKKWQGMLAAAKLILDKCENASGKPSYWNMTLEKRKAEQVPLGFEKALWETMEWKLNRSSIKCDKTLASENLPGNEGGNSTSGGPAKPSSGRSASDGRATEDSDQAAKTRRTNTDKTRMDDTTSGGTSLGRAMEDAIRSYDEGLDKAAATLAKATSEAGSAIAAKIGDVADAMRGRNTVLEMLVGVLARRGGGGNNAAYETADTDPSTR